MIGVSFMKKGFTLIELLAVIILLAVVALISTPIIINVVNDAKKSVESSNAQIYLSSVDLAMARNNLKEEVGSTTCVVQKNGNLFCSGLDKEIEVEVSNITAENGTIKFENGKIVSVKNLKVGDNYYAQNSDGKLVVSEPDFPCYIVSGDKYTQGSEIACGSEHFYVIKSDLATVTMLTANNITLSTTNPVQSSETEMLTFSDEKYWGESYFIDAYNNKSNLYPYIEAYKEKLINLDLVLFEARTISQNEINQLSIYKDDLRIDLLNVSDEYGYQVIELYGKDGLQNVVKQYSLDELWNFSSLTELEIAKTIFLMNQLFEMGGITEETEKVALVKNQIQNVNNGPEQYLPIWAAGNYWTAVTYGNDVCQASGKIFDCPFKYYDLSNIRPVIVIPVSNME